MAKKKAAGLGDLSANNFQAWAQATIQKYSREGMIVDAMVWGRIVALYDEALENARCGVVKKDGAA